VIRFVGARRGSLIQNETDTLAVIGRGVMLLIDSAKSYRTLQGVLVVAAAKNALASPSLLFKRVKIIYIILSCGSAAFFFLYYADNLLALFPSPTRKKTS